MQKQLAQLLEANRDELISLCQRVLRETLFLNRAEVRPTLLKNIALDETISFTDFLQQPSFSGAERGLQLYQTGLGAQAILRLGQAKYRFFLPYLTIDQVLPMLELVDAYQETVIQGYIKSLEKNIFIEQERTVNAFQRAKGSELIKV